MRRASITEEELLARRLSRRIKKISRVKQAYLDGDSDISVVAVIAPMSPGSATSAREKT